MTYLECHSKVAWIKYTTFQATASDKICENYIPSPLLNVGRKFVACTFLVGMFFRLSTTLSQVALGSLGIFQFFQTLRYQDILTIIIEFKKNYRVKK